MERAHVATRWMGVATLALAAVAPARSLLAEPADRTPTTRYVTVLAGKKLEEGRGFPGIVEVGSALPTVHPKIGYGREESAFGFWYFYDLGPWKLTVIARPDWERCNYLSNVEAVIVEGPGAPATTRGVAVGDPKAKVLEVYGKDPERLRDKIDSRGTTKTQWWAAGAEPDMTRRDAWDADIALGAYYPDAGLLFTFDDEYRVQRIIAIFEVPPLAIWLRDKPDSHPLYVVDVDPALTKPSKGKEPGSRLRLPAAPKLESVTDGPVTLRVPVGWKRTGTTWSSPLGCETVAFERSEATDGETAAGWFDREREGIEGVLLPKAQWNVPDAFAQAHGAAEAFAVSHQVAGAGIDGAALRRYVLYLAKGTHRLRVEVSRTAVDRDPSPDGLELARQVMTSVRWDAGK